MEMLNVFATIKENDLKVLMYKICQVLNHVVGTGNVKRDAVMVIIIEYFFVEKLLINRGVLKYC